MVRHSPWYRSSVNTAFSGTSLVVLWTGSTAHKVQLTVCTCAFRPPTSSCELALLPIVRARMNTRVTKSWPRTNIRREEKVQRWCDESLSVLFCTPAYGVWFAAERARSCRWRVPRSSPLICHMSHRHITCVHDRTITTACALTILVCYRLLDNALESSKICRIRA